ncbi:MAG: hypothetical protein IPN53_11120 [Comamonadaceae bacterium]|nr:hypothetical protein [Comamonadaceae bacterium]
MKVWFGASSRGVLHLSAAKRLPRQAGFSWPHCQQEAFAPIDHMPQRLFLGATVFTLCWPGALTWWLIQRLLQGLLAPLLAASRALVPARPPPTATGGIAAGAAPGRNR